MRDTVSLNTPDMRSISLDPEHFERLAALAASDHNADLFLTSIAGQERGDVIGLHPFRELTVTRQTSRRELTTFVFDDDIPTFGFLSYEYGHVLHGLLVRSNNGFPLGHLKKYAATLSYDRSAATLHIEEHAPDHGLDLVDLIETARAYEINLDPGGLPQEVRLSLNRDQYVERVKRTIEHIRDGYTYQLNLTTAFELAWPALDCVALFFALWRRHPASHYALITSGMHRIVSTSPELFIRARDGAVVSEPIKGTLRLDGAVADAVARLTSSVKEDAELSMIVDLIRNDLSYHCAYGTVRVEKHKATFVVDDLLQMHSRVGGVLRHDSTCLDLLFDAFPCGSVTGCPKKKTMGLIAELEPHTRDVYCGTIFAIRGKYEMESSVAIRSGYYDHSGAVFRFFAGSGIVVLSDPEAEYGETVAKAGKFLNLIAAKKALLAGAARFDPESGVA